MWIVRRYTDEGKVRMPSVGIFPSVKVDVGDVATRVDRPRREAKPEGFLSFSNLSGTEVPLLDKALGQRWTQISCSAVDLVAGARSLSFADLRRARPFDGQSGP